ncbi:hypothetical protein J2S43_001073 [Catenuloplanes nepalensis]|uniref:Helix-turn-helix domain-containing protein n=1 Tax=Catenuloplanes nepalensis TaxID=587533 RepID=A0ABT9MNC6_9ACTN|nr:hypothetical protein [Catenuloplanes nepalensis]MDP9792561.1 hypothetical protein [Catenuloplanes nepalensis]
MEKRELHAVSRWEWERVVLRARLRGLIPARGKRGGVAASTFRGIALVLASHADADTGGRIWPGDATVAVEAEVGIQVVQAVRRTLVALGLLYRVRARSRGQHEGDEYQLTLPSDLLERLEVLSPATVRTTAAALYAARRGPRRPANGTPTSTPPPPGVGVPPDPPHPADDGSPGGSDGSGNQRPGGSDGGTVGDPAARDTSPVPATNNTNPTAPGSSADVTTSRTRAPAARPHLIRCAPHGIAGPSRPDGRPPCAICRVLDDRADGRLRPTYRDPVSETARRRRP